MPTVNQLIKGIRRKKKKKCKTRVLQGKPQRKGVCFKVYTTNPKKPNSAIRKVAKVNFLSLKKYRRKQAIVYIPGQGHNLQKFSVVLVRAGRIKDLPGVKYKAVRGKYDFSFVESFKRSNARSKYGIKATKFRTKV